MARAVFFVALALSLSHAFSSAGFGQEEPVMVPSFEGLVEVSEVLLDVLAVDHEGQLVPGLGRADFIVEEEGEPVEITSVSYYTTRYRAGDVELEEGEVPASRYFIFLLHDQWTRYGVDLAVQQMRVAREARRWLREEMSPSDWVAVASFSSELRLHQDFTQDLESLEQALQRAVSGRPVEPRRREGIREPSVLGRLIAEQPRRRRGSIYEALRALAEACATIVGRKNLLLFTPGFGPEDRRFSEEELGPEYREAEVLLNDHNVAVYVIDTTPPGRGGSRSAKTLERVTEETGGMLFVTFSGFIRPLREVGEESYGYYLLSYQSTHPSGEIGYRKVDVRARDEGIQIRSRRGFRYGL